MLVDCPRSGDRIGGKSEGRFCNGDETSDGWCIAKEASGIEKQIVDIILGKTGNCLLKIILDVLCNSHVVSGAFMTVSTVVDIGWRMKKSVGD